MTKAPLRVGIVGVRRLRQGLGEHFARWLVAAGAEVPAFVGRTEESIADGARLLASRGIVAEGHTSLDRCLAACRSAGRPLDALVVASPAETHEPWLDAAADAGLHVLCEKPFVWGMPDPAAAARRIVGRFAAKGLVLHEHCQWPFTLTGFTQLHPDADPAIATRFEMELSPSGTGLSMVIDTASHVVSMLQAITAEQPAAPSMPSIEELVVTAAPGGTGGVALAFRFVRGSRRLDCAVRMQPHPSQPRPAAYAIDGRRADRRIRLPGYELSLADGARREVGIEDPMRLAVARFVAAASSGRAQPPDERRGIAERMSLVVRLVEGAAGAGA